MRLRHVILALFLPLGIAHAQMPASVHGVVFLDRNGDGIRQTNEPGFRGALVSNQDTVVVTDSAGRFALPPGPNRIVFVSEPDGFRSVGSFWHSVLDST